MIEQFTNIVSKILRIRESKDRDPVAISELDRKRVVNFIESGAAEDTDRFQELLNRVFTTERQAALLATASHDVKGRKVRYYRYIPYSKFKILLQKGSLRPTDYHEEAPHTEKSRELIKHFFIRYLKSISIDFDEKLSVYDMTLDDLVYKAFGNKADTETLERIFLSTDTSDWAAILEFIRENVDEVFMKKTHSGGPFSGQAVSDMISISVGGPIHSRLMKMFVYMELIIPDEKVIPYPEVRVEGERELFTREIAIENVARVYVSDTAITEEVVDNPATAVGSFIMDPESRRGYVGRVEEWRWDEPLQNNVPVAFYPLYHAREEARRAKQKNP